MRWEHASVTWTSGSEFGLGAGEDRRHLGQTLLHAHLRQLHHVTHWPAVFRHS